MSRPEAESEHELIEQCLRGDDVAWKELISRYQGLIYSVPRRMGLSPEDSSDVFQRVCILLYQRLSSVRDPRRLGGWLLTTASREAVRASRRVRRDAVRDTRRDDSETAPENDIPDPLPLADADRENLERAQILRSSISELSERCRMLLEAFLNEDSPNYRDIASRLGIPIGSIGPTRARCFAHLREMLQDRGLRM